MSSLATWPLKLRFDPDSGNWSQIAVAPRSDYTEVREWLNQHLGPESWDWTQHQRFSLMDQSNLVLGTTLTIRIENKALAVLFKLKYG